MDNYRLLNFEDVLTAMGIDPKATAGKKAAELARGLGLDVSEDEARAYGRDIELAAECASSCLSCPGLESCGLDVPGYELILVRNSMGLRTMTRPCARRIQADEAARADRVLASSRVPPLLRAKRLSDFDASESPAAMAFAMSAIRGNASKGAVLYGPPGVGKTHLAAAILNSRLLDGTSGLYATMPELMDDLRFAMRNNAAEEAMSLLTKTPFLFLDDVGAETPSEYVVEEFFKIINGRLLREAGGMTIITTNLSPKTFKQRYAGLGGDRIYSRLQELCQWIEVVGHDRRLAEATA